jgi:hypothetical protein
MLEITDLVLELKKMDMGTLTMVAVILALSCVFFALQLAYKVIELTY